MKTSKEIEEIINICRDHNIEVTKSIFFRTPEEIKRIIQKGITNEISPFKKQEEIQETIDMCKNNNVEIPESISFEKPEKIQEEINLWGKNNIGLIDTGKLPENGEYINKIR
ncbi:MAG: hypothetical protein E7170_04740 [Firmicutes bacterium]|nr:hypothetical protein [Bacillota bacterium]